MGLLISVMVRRKLNTSYPLFFGYIAVNVIALLACLGAYRYAFHKYFYVYWTCSTIMMLVGFTVQYEVFVDVLKPFSAVTDLGRMLFFWAAGFLFLAGILTAMVTSGSEANKVSVAVNLLDRCVHLMQCGLMLLMIVFERRLNLSWRSNGMTVALGLGITAAADLITSYAESRFAAYSAELEMVNGIIFTTTLCFWAFRLSRNSHVPSTAGNSPSRLIIQRWNEALISYRHGDLAFSSASMNSFLPGVEQTVEKVMARKMIQ
jgi:hypothetical protein